MTMKLPESDHLSNTWRRYLGYGIASIAGLVMAIVLFFSRFTPADQRNLVTGAAALLLGLGLTTGLAFLFDPGNWKRPSYSRRQSSPKPEVAQYLWEEYKYRHDMIWHLLFRVTAVGTILSIAPFSFRDLSNEGVGRWIAFLPVLTILMVLGSSPLFLSEYHLFSDVKEAYRDIQKQLMDVPPRKDVFRWLIPAYLSALLILGSVVAWLVLFWWCPKFVGC